MAAEKIYIGVDHEVRYDQARVGDAFLNDGDCSYTLTDSRTGEVVDSGTVPYQAGSDGLYLGVIDAAVTRDLIEGRVYFVDLAFTSDEYEDARRDRLPAAHRSGEE